MSPRQKGAGTGRTVAWTCTHAHRDSCARETLEAQRHLPHDGACPVPRAIWARSPSVDAEGGAFNPRYPGVYRGVGRPLRERQEDKREDAARLGDNGRGSEEDRMMHISAGSQDSPPAVRPQANPDGDRHTRE